MFKRKLTKAIILSLALSSVIASSTSAATVYIDQVTTGKSVNMPNDDVIIDQSDGTKFASSSPVWIEGNIVAKSFTILNENSKGGTTQGKGINAYGGSVDITADTVTIKSYDDAIFTTRGDSVAGKNVTITMHELNLSSVRASGIINNGLSDVSVIGDSGSSVTIVAGDTGSSRSIAVSNQSQGHKVDISADNIYLEAKGDSTIRPVIYSGPYSSGSDANDNVTNITANNSLELKSRDYMNDKSTSTGYAIYVSAGALNVNKGISAADVTINGNTHVNGSSSVLNIDIGGTRSVINGKLQTEHDGIINAAFTGQNAKLNGDIWSAQTEERWLFFTSKYIGGKITATFSGDNGAMEGNIIADKLDDKQGEVEVNFTGANASLTGDMQNNGGIITADFSGANAQWTGISSIENDGTTDVSLSNNSTWNMTDTSSVTTLANNAMVDMTADGGKGSKLNVVTLSGSGSFTMNLVYLGNDITAYNGDSNTTSDFISVTGDSSGSHKIYFDNTDSNLGAMSVDDKLYFAEVQGSATFGDGKTITEVNAKKLYDRDFAIDSEDNDNSGKNWFITATERPVEPVDPEDPITPVDPVKPNENITSEEGKMRASYALGIEMDRLNKRLGESRYLNEDEDHGLWVRYRYNRNAWDNSYRTIGNMFQVGYDKLREEKDGRHIRGGAIDYTDANTTLKDVNGHGDHKRYSMSLYDTWTGDKGHYYDLVLRGGRIHSEFDVNMRGGRDIKSDYHRNFGSISGEYGRKLDGKKGWYVEPQAQLQVGVVGSGKYTTNYGVAVEQDTATSVQGRLGFRLGREMNNAEGNKRSNYYFKADVLHDFAGDQAYRVTSADGSDSYEKKFDGHDTWYDIGVGCDVKLSKNRYFFADVERSFGSDLDATWQVNGGFRWEF